MFQALLYSLIFISILWGQDYRWPIRASQSLSATFCEFRSGHLHAGIDIKTWGEMEVPCLAIADGYIERILVGYNGYGRGLFLRLNDGNLAVYGHLEEFSPIMETLIKSQQLESNKYSMRLEFDPDQFPVRSGEVIGYSGTSGTEHPHLHFEIRDSLRNVHNPQLFYPGIKDTQPPVFDEILLLPAGAESRVNESLLPSVVDLSEPLKPIEATGPFQVAINAHDRSDGTYNKYNVFRTDAYVNDSLIFKRQFDEISMRLMDDVDHVYPGFRGKRGWRFMALYDDDLTQPSPSAPETLHGTISPEGLSNLEIRVTDFKGNQTAKEIVFQYQDLAHWEIEALANNFVITRSYSGNGFENIKFYTGDNTFIPVSETLYRLHSTTWVLDVASGTSGIRALGSSNSSNKWILPPQAQNMLEISTRWVKRFEGYILRIESDDPTTFPIRYRLNLPDSSFTGELRQTAENQAESEVLPLSHRAQADRLDLLRIDSVIHSTPLDPLLRLQEYESKALEFGNFNISLRLSNTGEDDVYLQADTVTAEFDSEEIVGIGLDVIQNQSQTFRAELSFTNANFDSSFTFFAPGKKDSWERLSLSDSSKLFSLDVTEGGSFFLFQDTRPPIVKPIKRSSQVKRGQRLVYKIRDNTGRVPYPRTGLLATLDGTLFFPDYNPLRKELSFHIPSRMSTGKHTFEIRLRDESGNSTTYTQTFNVTG